MKITLTTLTLSALLLTGCDTLTGIPSHGGGKRFAVEQELVAPRPAPPSKKWICPP